MRQGRHFIADRFPACVLSPQRRRCCAFYHAPQIVPGAVPDELRILVGFRTDRPARIGDPVPGTLPDLPFAPRPTAGRLFSTVFVNALNDHALLGTLGVRGAAGTLTPGEIGSIRAERDTRGRHGGTRPRNAGGNRTFPRAAGSGAASPGA